MIITSGFLITIELGDTEAAKVIIYNIYITQFGVILQREHKHSQAKETES